MRETVRDYVSEGSKYVWICSIKIQNLHNCSWVVSETANGYEYAWISLSSEYALIYMNMSNCARTLNMPESAKTYTNVGKYASVCLKLWIYFNMPET